MSISTFLLSTARSIFINDSGLLSNTPSKVDLTNNSDLNDTTENNSTRNTTSILTPTTSPSYITAFINSLCESDKYRHVINVDFGVKPIGSMDCEIKQNVTMERGIFKVPPDIVVGPGQEYCYKTALISNENSYNIMVVIYTCMAMNIL